MITLIPAGNPGAFTGPTGNNTWLIDGAEPLLVDAGVGHDAHLDALKAALAGRPLAHVFVTHAHSDHASGIPRLRAEWPGLKVVEGAGGAAAIGRFTIVPTPGHSHDHACLWDPETRALFSGDLIISGGTVMIAASSGGSLREYLASLARVRALDAARVYPGHGAVIDAPAALIDHYIAHRLEREQQVVQALHGRPSTVDALVAIIYPYLDKALQGAARETLMAHLRKLEEESSAEERDGAWQLR